MQHAHIGRWTFPVSGLRTDTTQVQRNLASKKRIITSMNRTHNVLFHLKTFIRQLFNLGLHHKREEKKLVRGKRLLNVSFFLSFYPRQESKFLKTFLMQVIYSVLCSKKVHDKQLIITQVPKGLPLLSPIFNISLDWI